MAPGNTTAILRIPGVLGVFSVLGVANCVLGEEGDVTIAQKQKRKQQRGAVLNRFVLLEAPAKLFVVFGEN